MWGDPSQARALNGGKGSGWPGAIASYCSQVGMQLISLSSGRVEEDGKV